MVTPSTLKPVKKRHRVRPRVARRAPAPPVALALVSATYQSGANVTLTFNRAIDISAIGVSDFLVSDGSGTGYLWVGMGASAAGPDGVVVELEQFESASAGPVLLTVNGANGIVAAGDDEPWPGMTDLPLPYEQ